MDEISNTIESLFSTAHSAHFFTTPNYEKEPPVIFTLFDDANMASQAYDMTLDFFKEQGVTLLLSQSNTTLTLTLVSQTNGKRISIRDLNYNAMQLDNFLKKEEPSRAFVFVAALKNLTIIATREPFSPMVLRGYKITG